jgi:hypothetical protein
VLVCVCTAISLLHLATSLHLSLAIRGLNADQT